MNTEQIITKMRALKIDYQRNFLWRDPSKLRDHFAMFESYTGILYSHHAEFSQKYIKKEAAIEQEEGENKDKADAEADAAEKKRTYTQAEVDRRRNVRIADLKAMDKLMTIELAGAKLHINAMQSVMKDAGDEAKGLR